MKKQLISKLNTVVVLVGMLLNIMPIQVFAETTNTIGIKLSEAILLDKDGNEITKENRIAADAEVTAKIHWEQSEEGLLEDGTVLSYQLPENLSFQKVSGDLKDGQGQYQVEDNLLTFSLNKNYDRQEESELADPETVKFYTGDLELTAKTIISDVEEEAVLFEEHVSPILYYELTNAETEETTSATRNSDLSQEETKETTEREAKKEKTTKKAERAVISDFNVTGLKLEKASSTAPSGWVEIQAGDKTNVGDFIRLKIDWEILNSLSIANGDYVEIDLPTIFKFAPTAKIPLSITVDGQSYMIGDYQLLTVGDHSKIRIEFNDTIKQNNITSITNGHFTFQGSLNETKGEQEKVEIGSITLPDFEIGDPVLNEIGPGTYQDFSKEGSQRQNENALSWRIVTNYPDLMRAYKGEGLQNRYENSVMVDELAEGLEFTSLNIQIPVLLADASDASKLYARQVDSLSVNTNQVSPLSTYQDSYDFVKNSPAGTYTVFTDSVGKQKVIMNMGTFPVTQTGDKTNCLSLSQSKSDAIQKISTAYDSNTTLPSANKANTLKALENLFDASQDTGIVGFLVNIVTKVDDDHLGQTTFDNKASIDYDGDRSVDAEANNVHFQDITGGGTGTIPKGTVEIIKKDQDSKENLPNIVFSVVKYDGDVEGIEVDRLTTNDQGKVKFENLAIGKYKIKEISGLENYSPKMIIENQTGLTTDGVFEIKATDSAGFQFTILNKKMTVKHQLKATKTLSGRDLQANEFEFELLDDQGNILDTKKNDGSGDVLFEEIAYDKAGTYEYTIREKAGSDSTIGYDKTEYKATVTVKDTGGKLEASVVYSGTVNFENTYTPAAGSAVLEATKSLTGRELQADEFEFELVDDQGKVVDTKTNDDTGNIYFDAISYDKAGTYKYTIREKAGNNSTINYDKTEYQATVTVKDIDGKLEATVVYSDTVNFENTYNEPGNGEVTLKKIDDKTGQVLANAEFELQNEKGELIKGLDKIVTNEKGEVTISNLEVGNYQVVETKAPQGYVIDKTPVKFAITKENTAKKELVKENKKQSKGIFLKKTDSTNQKVLANAEFKLQTDSKKVLKEKLTTDENGLIYLSDLEPGKYEFVETKAPEGYKIDKTPVSFEINENEAKVIKLVKENAPLLPNVSESNKLSFKYFTGNTGSNGKSGILPRTGSKNRISFVYLGIMILLVVLLISYRRYKARKID